MAESPRDRARDESRQARLHDIKRELANSIDDQYGGYGDTNSLNLTRADVNYAGGGSNLVKFARENAIAKRKMDREGTAPKSGLYIEPETPHRPLKDI